MRRTAASEFFAVLILFTACTSVVPGTPPIREDVCYAPWEAEPYKSGRAIPAPGPDAEVPLCGL